ncbi:NAD(P)/FAD-dependent oxidoreductase, partial [Candidatus Pelagibacter sp.]|nr:NAD(P)/FAD-dependent oxidoreductase [Candidatus Pelagibacter sp.]
MLLLECEWANVEIKKEFVVNEVDKDNNEYVVKSADNIYKSNSLVVATGGLSVPKIGASSFGYEVAKK